MEHIEDDSIKLLRECNAGVKMGASSIEDVLDHVQSAALLGILKDSHDIHCQLGNKTHELLEKYQDDGKEPAAMAKVMSKFKTELKTMGDDPDHGIADLITDGCNMGIKSLYQYLNEYPAADKEIIHLTKDIISTEEKLLKALRPYL